MTIERIRELYNAQPFQPFVIYLELIPEPSPSGRGQGEGKHDVGAAARVLAIHEYWDKHLADGREISVRHRDFMMVAPSGRTVAVHQPDDSLNIIDLLLMTDLEVAGPSNGTRRRPRKRR